jgi:hypothetical protein
LQLPQNAFSGFAICLLNLFKTCPNSLLPQGPLVTRICLQFRDPRLHPAAGGDVPFPVSLGIFDGQSHPIMLLTAANYRLEGLFIPSGFESYRILRGLG